MPNTYELSLMSLLVYPDIENEYRDRLQENGWMLIDEMTLNQYGYLAKAYCKANEIIIAHCGTRHWIAENIKTNLSVFNSQYGLFRPSELPNTFGLARNFSLRMRNNYPGYNIFETGHSLGGMYAQLNAYEHGGHAITFDNPGCGEYISLREQVQGYPAVKRNSMTITEYLCTPSIINTLGTHIGDIRRIFLYHLSIEGHNTENLYMQGSLITALMFAIRRGMNISITGVGLYALEKLYYWEGRYTMRMHSVKRINAHFNNQLKESLLHARMQSWPTLGNYIQASMMRGFQNLKISIMNNLKWEPRTIQANREYEEVVSKITNYRPIDISTHNQAMFNNLQQQHKSRFVEESCRSYQRFFDIRDPTYLNRYNTLKTNLCQNAQLPLHIIDDNIHESQGQCCPCSCRIM